MKTFMDTLVPEQMIKTRTVEEALAKGQMCVASGTITAFDGQPGLGKTTTAAYVARQTTGDITWHYLSLPQKGSAKEVIDKVHGAVLGPAGDLTRRTMEQLLTERLADLECGLVVDEVHGCAFRGLQQVRFLHDEVYTLTGRGFPLILSGVGIDGYMRGVPELWGRVDSWVYFNPLDGEDKTSYARKVHPRLAKTGEKRIDRLSLFVDGETLRGWARIARMIDRLPSSRSTSSKPLSKTDVDTLEAMVS